MAAAGGRVPGPVAAAEIPSSCKGLLFDLLQFGDVARHLFLACRDPVKAMRYLLLIGGDTRGDPVDGARYLVLTGGDPVDALPRRVEIEGHRVELLLIGRRGGWHSKRAHVGSVRRIWCGLRCQPAQLWVRARDQLSGRIAV